MNWELGGKRLLVTGGAGFFGSHLSKRLLNEKADVLVVDNYFTGRQSNIVHLLANPCFEAMRHDNTILLHLERQSDIAKAPAILDLCPKVTLENVLKETIEYFKNLFA